MSGYKKYKIYLSPEFISELDSIYYYLLYNLKNHVIAKKMRYSILKKVYSLDFLPNRFPNLNLTNNNFKKLYFNNFIILYKINDKSKQIYVLHIFHKNQDYLNLI